MNVGSRDVRQLENKSFPRVMLLHLLVVTTDDINKAIFHFSIPQCALYFISWHLDKFSCALKPLILITSMYLVFVYLIFVI